MYDVGKRRLKQPARTIARRRSARRPPWRPKTRTRLSESPSFNANVYSCLSSGRNFLCSSFEKKFLSASEPQNFSRGDDKSSYDSPSMSPPLDAGCKFAIPNVIAVAMVWGVGSEEEIPFPFFSFFFLKGNFQLNSYILPFRPWKE